MRRIRSTKAEPIDLLTVAGGPIAERALPAGAIAAIVVMVIVRRRGLRVLFGLIAAVLVAALTQSLRSASRSGGR